MSNAVSTADESTLFVGFFEYYFLSLNKFLFEFRFDL